MTADAPSEISTLLRAAAQGDAAAADELLTTVYEELRKIARARMAAESPGHTLQTTALVHEAVMRLIGSERGLALENRGHFFAAAAESMRRILVDRARHRARLKRGGGRKRVGFDAVDAAAIQEDPAALLAVNDALLKLDALDGRLADVVRLRFFAGLTIAQTAEVLHMTPRTVNRAWDDARVWLHKEIASAT